MNSNSIVENDYTYDQNGNRLTNAISDNAGLIRTEEYGYDALSRLTSVDYDDGQTQTYAFDAMGNRTQKADSVNGTENYTYNNANMLLTRGMNSYTNDDNGNTLTGGGRTNTWDGQNRLTQCVYGGTTTTFTYGADGLRRSSASGGTTTNFVIEGDNVLRETQGGSTTATYLHGPRGPESRRDGSNVYRWYVYDGLGSALAEVDSSGTVTATRKYDVYGAVRATTGTGTSRHKFVGALGHPSEDGSGLIYMRARYYDPFVGRFASQDSRQDGQNWFEYSRSSPTTYVDRSGCDALDDILRELAEDIRYAREFSKLASKKFAEAAYWDSVALSLDGIPGEEAMAQRARLNAYECRLEAKSLMALNLKETFGAYGRAWAAIIEIISKDPTAF